MRIFSAVSTVHRTQCVTDGQIYGQTSCNCIVRAMHTRRAVKSKLHIENDVFVAKVVEYMYRLKAFWYF